MKTSNLIYSGIIVIVFSHGGRPLGEKQFFGYYITNSLLQYHGKTSQEKDISPVGSCFFRKR